MAFCQMPWVLSEADVCIRLLAGIFTRPAVAGMVGAGGCESPVSDLDERLIGHMNEASVVPLKGALNCLLYS